MLCIEVPKIAIIAGKVRVTAEFSIYICPIKIMACHNKFQTCLNLEHLDFAPTTLIVGTFNPEWPVDNATPWFYGNTAVNYFWDILPRIYGQPSLKNATEADWKRFCREQQIALTDLISSIDDADPGNPAHVSIFTGNVDKAIAFNFEDFVFTDIVQILRSHPSIKNIYLTRGITEAFWRYIWNPVMHYCQMNNIRERRLLTPSVISREQHDVYNKQNPGDKIPLLEDYLIMKWQQEWHFNK